MLSFRVFKFGCVSVLAASFAAQTVFAADVLTLTKGTKVNNGVTLATLAVTESNVTLAPVGAGLRSKSVVGFPVKVYVTELFSSDVAHFDRTSAGAVNSPNQAGATSAIVLTFVRGVGMSDIENAFNDSFNSNNISQSDSDISSFMAAIQAGGDAANGGQMVILGERKADGDHVIYESTNGYQKEIIGKPGFVKNVFAIWLGNPADSGLATLKANLLNPGTVGQ